MFALLLAAWALSERLAAMRQACQFDCTKLRTLICRRSISCNEAEQHDDDRWMRELLTKRLERRRSDLRATEWSCSPERSLSGAARRSEVEQEQRRRRSLSCNEAEQHDDDFKVNAANERMLGGGGVDGAIHRAAGPELKTACYELPEVRPGVRCPTGEARITPAFQLPVSRVIHTVGPIYGAVDKPEVLLRNAYINSLKVAKENNIHYIAFPAISCGVYRYPFDEASKIAISAIKEFPSDFKEVHFVLFSDDTYRAWLETALEFM